MTLGTETYWATLKQDAGLLLPEVVLVVGMCAVILAPFLGKKSKIVPAVVTLVTLAAALVTVLLSLSAPGAGAFAFAGMVAVDPFSQFFKLLLMVFSAIVVVQWLAATRRSEAALDLPDFFCLMLGAATGMALMASASNLLMIFIATEAASIPSYALAGFRKKTKVGSEGALKYVIFGAAATAITLYGMSLVYGATGQLSLSGIAAAAGAGDSGFSPLLAVGLLATFAGIAFKLSAVPMHFWCPDVFQGAPIAVTTFLSVASKGAAVCLLVRFLAAFGGVGEGHLGLAIAVGILGGVTATWGNLAALAQTNIKRLLAYSSIGHSGYMIMAASLAAVGGGDVGVVAAAVLFYLVVYVFMNAGAFTVAALLAEQAPAGEDGEDIRGYVGLSRRAPVLAALLALFLLSLFGFPGLGGFIGKIVLGVAMLGAGAGGFVLIAVLLLNTLLSLYFYLRPVYFMYLARDERDVPGAAPRTAPFVSVAALALLAVCAVGVVWTGLLPTLAQDLAKDHAVLATPVAASQVALHDAPPDVPTAAHAAAHPAGHDTAAGGR